MSFLLQAALVLLLIAMACGIVFAGLLVWIRLAEGDTFWQRAAWLPAALALLVAGFVVIVELRCALGWIDESECHAWDQE